MTMTGIRPTGTLALIAKAARVDPDGTAMLLAFAWQDTLDEIIAKHAGELDAALDEDLGLLRRAIIRTYIAKRADGEDVTELLELADDLGVTTVTKNDAEPGTPYERETGRPQPRGAGGKWIRFLTGHTETTSVTNGATTTTTETRHPGLVDFFRTPAPVDGKARVSRAAYLTGESGRPGDRAIYRQLRAGGDAIASTTRGTPQAIGVTARSIGEIGPEAERILGTSVRRTAYRYRGTERRPDKAFADEVTVAAQIGQHLSPEGQLPPSLADKGHELHQEYRVATARRPGAAVTPVSSAAGALGHNAANQQLTSDQLRMRAAGDVAVRELAGRVPNLHLAAISLRAGKLPPSVGVIIDEDGDLVVEAQGYNGDHYLPFDLRNLGRLHGGQYVRTRTTGGPTDEDIYTALLTGTRQIQVVSNSGVFTVELDPSLRGGRRYNDKAAQMVGRYSALLAELGSGKVLAAELTPEQRSQIRSNALRRAGRDPVKAATLVTEETDKMIAGIAFSDQNEEEIEARARAVAQAHWRDAQTGNKPKSSSQSAQQVYDDALAEERQRARDAAARVYRLNGEGYNAALEALAQEFPFYIRDVKWEPMPDFLAARKYGTTDRKPLDRVADLGYTTRGALAPVRAGGKQPDQAPTATPTPPATAPTATPTAAAVEPVRAKLSDTPFGAKFAQTVPALGTFLRTNAEQIGAPDNGASSIDEANAKVQSPLNWWGWATAHHGGPQGVGKWLLNDADDEHLSQFDQLLNFVAASPVTDSFMDTQLPELRGLVGQIRTVRTPYAAPEDNPVLAVPDDENPRPQPITEAIQAANSTPEQADAWLETDPDLKDALAELAGKTDTERIAVITPQVRRLKEQLEFARRAAADPEHADDYRTGDATGDIDTADAIQMWQDLQAGMPPPDYQQVAALQKAWTFLRAIELRKLLGQAGGAAPFVPGLPDQQQVRKQAPRTRLVLHDPSSPAARGLQRRGHPSPVR